MHVEPQKSGEKKRKLPKHARLVALTTSYNQLFNHQWNPTHAQINQTTGCIRLLIAFTLLNDRLHADAGGKEMEFGV